ncbi:hypothetical protein HMPREF9074_08788 [Capnocytophaga sp. oral taxon 329 str. F0087]|nr:hypothetical protein HMPREF9074_08788 [Capnocytophaga sp. oral taxon 329 str. F0087]
MFGIGGSFLTSPCPLQRGNEGVITFIGCMSKSFYSAKVHYFF